MMTSGVLYADYSGYDVTLTQNVVFAHRESGDLTMQILTPFRPNYPYQPCKMKENDPKARFHHGEPPKDPRRFPLVVGVPGSGWSGADGVAFVPRMMALAQQGYVVACVSYRGTFKDDVRFPAAVQDVKQGLRFCERVREAGGTAEFYKIVGAQHGAGCWTLDAMKLVIQFLKATL